MTYSDSCVWPEGLTVTMFSGKQQAEHHSTDNGPTDDHFPQTTSETYERYVFNTRKQKTQETVNEYISALRTLASTCNFCDCLKNSLLRDRIVLGIKDGSTRKRLLQKSDLNLETCIAMCQAAGATSSSQPLKTVTTTEGTTVVQGGSASTEAVSRILKHSDLVTSPDEVEMSEVNFNTELGDSEGDSVLLWITEHQSSGFPRDWIKHNKQESTWSMEEDLPDQPSAICTTTQPMSDNTSGALLSDSESPTPDKLVADICYITDINKVEYGSRKVTTEKIPIDIDIDKEEENNRIRHCDVFRKSSSEPIFLKRHRYHRNYKPFLCDVCSKSFSQAGGLRVHKRLHTGERPHKCPHCNRDFKDFGTLQCHIKSVHEGCRPHLCEICGAAFSFSGHLTVHIRTHTGEKPHVCSDCRKGFSSSSALKRHQLTHTGQKPHSCPHCSFACRRAHDLKKHIQKTHQ